MDTDEASVFGWLKRAFGGSAKQFERDENWVLVGLLLCTALSDGALEEAEAGEIEAIAHRVPYLRDLSKSRLVELAGDHVSQLRTANRVTDHVKRVAAGAPKDASFRASTLALCADIALLDRALSRAEAKTLAAIAQALNLPRALTKEILTVIAWKNAFRPHDPKLAERIATTPKRKLPAGEPEWTRGQCLLALLLGMAYCDGSASMDEEAAIDAFLVRAKALNDVVGSDRLFGETEASETQPTRVETIARVHAFISGSFRPMLNFRGLFAITDKAVRTLPRSRLLARSIYALCADIGFADRDITPAEEKYLHDIGVRLRLPKKERDVIRRVMAWKNRNGILSLAAAVGR